MFPACAGMNRGHLRYPWGTWHVPRVRGDEPEVSHLTRRAFSMFPACAGMNRVHVLLRQFDVNVPRVRGDEPQHMDAYRTLERCSPRARG